jgi:hypothetical protein
MKGDGVTYPAEVARQWKQERDEARELAGYLLFRLEETDGITPQKVDYFKRRHPWLEK